MNEEPEMMISIPLSMLEEHGLTWNDEEKRIVKMPWRAEKGESYWTFNTTDYSVFAQYDERRLTDKVRYRNGFYFQTQKSALNALNAIIAFAKKLER